MDESEDVEAEVRALHGLDDEGVDLALIREVLKSDQLSRALAGDTVLSRLVTQVTDRLDEASKIWQTEANPSSARALKAHSDARACRILIDWIEYELNMGQTAEKILERGDD
jgi:hypothetical protein